MKILVSIIFHATILTALICGQNAPSQKQNKLMADREAYRLKGRVKQVIEETADLKFKNRKFIESKRETDSVTEYDTQGNRVKRDAYSSGKLFLKETYGNLDGEKISKQEFIDDPNSPPILAVSSQKEKPKDNHFSYKFRYKYDEKGNRIEEVLVSNTGEIWIQDTITFDENGNITKQVRRHRGESKISSINTFKYNDKGLLTEETITLENDNEPERYESSESDSNGNWIKRTVKRKKRDGSFEPFLISYRKITYFN